MPYALLGGAIALEVVALVALKHSVGFSRVGPAGLFVVAIAGSFFLESLVMQRLPMALVYASWSGLGVVAMVVVGALFYNEPLNLRLVLGVACVVVGVAILVAGGAGERAHG